MATSDFFASSAADSEFVPESNCTLAPGTFALTAFKGEVGNHTCSCHFAPGRPGGSTCADPPPEIMLALACAPIIAMECNFVRSSGSTPSLFLSSTVLCSARRRAVSSPPSTSTTPFFGGSSMIPQAHSDRRMRRTWSSSSVVGTVPACTASLSFEPKNWSNGSSLSNPAADAFTVLCVPAQSDTTNPLKPQAFFSTSVSRYLFSQAKSPLSEL